MTVKDVKSLSSYEEKLPPDERRRRLKEIQLPEYRKIIKHPDFEIAWPERVSWVGFLVILTICIAIVYLTYLAGALLAAK